MVRKFPTIKEVAERAGVSPATVSAVLNDRPGISEATREKVLTVVRELGYSPNIMARGLVKKVSPNVIFVVPNYLVFGSSINAALLESVGRALDERAYHLVLLSLKDDFWGHKFVQRMDAFFKMYRPAGVMFLDVYISRFQLKYLRELDVPIVFLNQEITAPGVGVVTSDNLMGGAFVANHFIELGIRKPAIVGPVSTPIGRVRKEGFLKAWEEAGFSFRDVLIVDTHVWYIGEELLLLNPLLKEVEGVFALSDRLAAALLAEYKRAGLGVPHDIVVVGYDDEPFASFTTPPLTTVRQDGIGLGRRAVDILFSGGKGKFVQEVELIIRDSTRKEKVEGGVL